MFTTAIHNQESVEALGKDYGIKAIDGTGPWCFESWQPRTEIVLKRHDAYKWGPSMYQNKGPVKFEKLSIKIVPEDASRVAAMLGGQFDVTHQIPLQFIQQVKAAPNLNVQEATAQLPADVLRLQDHAADGGRQARARGDEHRHQPRRHRQGHHAGQCRAGATPSSIPRRSTSPSRPRASSRKTSSAPKKLLDEAGWKVGADGIREKDGVKLAPRVLFTQVGLFPAHLRSDPGLHAQDRHRLEDRRLRLHDRARRDGQAGLTSCGP